jgi:hypothetical protein
MPPLPGAAWTASASSPDVRCLCYVQQYKAHERSRESIELAFDSILQKKYKLRHKYGFRPPATGRKTDLAADEEVLHPVHGPLVPQSLRKLWAACSCGVLCTVELAGGPCLRRHQGTGCSWVAVVHMPDVPLPGCSGSTSFSGRGRLWSLRCQGPPSSTMVPSSSCWPSGEQKHCVQFCCTPWSGR